MTRVSFNINITDDELFEGPETFNVAILSGSLPRFVDTGNHVRATITIVDDEKRKSIFIYYMLLRHMKSDLFALSIIMSLTR